MHLALDHLAVAARTLEEGVAHVEAVLGVEMAAGGMHPDMGTHNKLLSLGPDVYLEVIAIDPDATPPGHRRWFDLDAFDEPPRLTNWIVRTDDLDAALAAAPGGSGSPRDLARGDLRWRMAVPDDGRLPYDGVSPALIEWSTGGHPAGRLPDAGLRLECLEVTHPNADMLLADFPALTGLPRVAITAGETSGLFATIRTRDGTRRLS